MDTSFECKICGKTYSTIFDVFGRQPCHKVSTFRGDIRGVITSDCISDIPSEDISEVEDTPIQDNKHTYCIGALMHFKQDIILGNNPLNRYTYGDSFLHRAIDHGANANIIKILLENGADVNAQNDDLNTPLHYLVLQLSKFNFCLYDSDEEVIDVLDLLLGCNADFRIDNVNESSSYDLVSKNHVEEVIKNKILSIFDEYESPPETKGVL